jgi:hypothetical protein
LLLEVGTEEAKQEEMWGMSGNRDPYQDPHQDTEEKGGKAALIVAENWPWF